MLKLKRKLVLPVLAALIIAGFPSSILGAGLRGGFYGAAAPINLVPASADVYVELNRAGTLGDNLAALVRTYQAHPGTAAALARLRASIGPAALQQFNTLLTAAPARVGVFATIPTNSSTQPQVAVIAQLKPASFMNGGNPLSGLATFSPSTSYRGTSIYRVTFAGGLGGGYGAIVSGDGVIAGDVASVQSVIDAATFHAPSLATDPDFNTTLAQIPALRTMTVYVGRRFLTGRERTALQQAGSAGGMAARAAARVFERSYAVGVTAYPNGISVVSSALPRTSPLFTTPNNGANIVGNTAIAYVSLANLAELLRASGVLSAGTLTQAQAQTGINIAGDVLPLISREVVVDINDETSPLLTTVLVASGSSGGASSLGSVPELPGSLELATEVADQASAQRSVDRIVASLTKAAGGSAASGSLFQKTTLPDGSTGYVVTVLPSLGYTFRQTGGHTFLVISSNLPEDVRASATPLSADADYKTALANVAGPGALVSINYTNISRLLGLVDRVLDYARTQKAVSASDLATYRQDAEPLIAPFRSMVTVSRAYGAQDTQTQMFISVR